MGDLARVSVSLRRVPLYLFPFHPARVLCLFGGFGCSIVSDEEEAIRVLCDLIFLIILRDKRKALGFVFFGRKCITIDYLSTETSSFFLPDSEFRCLSLIFPIDDRLVRVLMMSYLKS